MKKITLITMVSALSCTTLVHAGGMGDIDAACMNTFIGLEIGYSKNSINGFTATIPSLGITMAPVASDKGESGRISAGILNKMYDEMGVTGEVGWGYYGRTTYNTNAANTTTYFTNGYTITGFDALLGLSYVSPSFNLYLKAGALIQNLTYTANAYINPPDASPLITFTNEANSTQALPEIKIGGIYNFNDNWGLSVSYLHVFGNSPESTAAIDTDGNLLNATTNTQNPSLDTVFVGLQYSF